MTTRRILAAAVIFSIIPIAVGAAFRDARSVVPPQLSAEAPQPLAEAPQPSAELNFDERWIPIAKGNRLPLPKPTPFAVAAAQPEVAPPVAPPPGQLPLATDDDIKQAEAEHRRPGDICRRGRTYFTIQHHQYWRCR
jgi:hypothetical protein